MFLWITEVRSTPGVDGHAKLRIFSNIFNVSPCSSLAFVCEVCRVFARSGRDHADTGCRVADAFSSCESESGSDGDDDGLEGWEALSWVDADEQGGFNSDSAVFGDLIDSDEWIELDDLSDVPVGIKKVLSLTDGRRQNLTG